MAALILLIARLTGLSEDVAKVGSIVVGIALALGSLWAGYEFIKHLGAEEVRQEIQKENQDAILKGTGAGRTLDECIAAGGLYDFGRQRCRDIPPGDR